MFNRFRYYFLEYLKANFAAYFFMTLVLAIGIVVGALAVKTMPDNQKNELIGYLNIFFSGLKQDAIVSGDIINTVLINNIKTIVIIWVLGFTIIGIPFVLFILFTRGFIIGFTVGFLVNEYVIKGLVFALVSVLPHNFFAVPAVLAASVAAIKFSTMLIKNKKQGKVNLLSASLNYTGLCLCTLAIIMLAGVVEVFVSPVFMRTVINIMAK